MRYPPFTHNFDFSPAVALLEELKEKLKEDGRSPTDWVQDVWFKSDADVMPCFWLDQESMLCKHYEHRPCICREHDCSNKPFCTIYYEPES